MILNSLDVTVLLLTNKRTTLEMITQKSGQVVCEGATTVEAACAVVWDGVKLQMFTVSVVPLILMVFSLFRLSQHSSLCCLFSQRASLRFCLFPLQFVYVCICRRRRGDNDQATSAAFPLSHSLVVVVLMSLMANRSSHKLVLLVCPVSSYLLRLDVNENALFTQSTQKSMRITVGQSSASAASPSPLTDC